MDNFDEPGREGYALMNEKGEWAGVSRIKRLTDDEIYFNWHKHINSASVFSKAQLSSREISRLIEAENVRRIPVVEHRVVMVNTRIAEDQTDWGTS